ncbi:MAG: hypothetical protein ACRD6W_18570, partial [Nitrososphaerales archaeon]
MSTIAPPSTSHSSVRGDEPPLSRPTVRQYIITSALVAGPAVGLAVVLPMLWGHAVNVTDLVMAVVLYV